MTRFSDIRVHTGAPREILTARLRKLEAEGLISRRRYSDRPPRDEYLLTQADAELAPALSALRQWGERHAHRRPDTTGSTQPVDVDRPPS